MSETADCGCVVCELGDAAPPEVLRHARYHELYWSDPETWGPRILARCGLVPEPRSWPPPRDPSRPPRRRPLAANSPASSPVRSPANSPPKLPPPVDRVLFRVEHLASWTGYGQIAIHAAEALERTGVPVDFFPLRADERYLPLPEFVRARRQFDPRRGAPGSWIFQIGVPMLPPLPGRPTVHLTMWEVDRVPPESVQNLNRCAAIIVPCRHNAEMLVNCGVTAPVHTVPMGVDRSVFTRTDDPPLGDEFVFGCAGRVMHGGARKNLDAVIAAFLAAKDAMPGSRLEVKCWPDDPIAPFEGDRVKVVREPLTESGMADWYRGLSVYVTASRGEGWGLQTHQAMAVGRPVIAVPWSATVDFWEPGVHGWALPYTLGEARDFYGGYTAKWANPEPGSIERAMLAAYADRESCVRMGRAAAVRAAEFPWDRTGWGLRVALGRAGLLARPAPKNVAVIRRDASSRAYRCGSFAKLSCGRGRCATLGREVTTFDDCRYCPALPA
jgi:glycosyltransferase involved in cell wall biosynthesis